MHGSMQVSLIVADILSDSINIVVYAALLSKSAAQFVLIVLNRQLEHGL